MGLKPKCFGLRLPHVLHIMLSHYDFSLILHQTEIFNIIADPKVYALFYVQGLVCCPKPSSLSMLSKY